ncbi:MAG: benzoate/H(+) symporter BenE family transporter [Bacillota bacterium]
MSEMEFQEHKPVLIEKGPGFAAGLRNLWGYLNIKTATAGVVAGIFGCTGPVLIIMNSAAAGSLTEAQTVSWLFAVYFFGGLISLLLALYYQLPVNGAWSMPGAVLMASALTFYNINQAVGAYFMAGVIVLLLGISGLIGKVMKWLPLPIVMAMIAGAMIRFGTGIVNSLQGAPLIAGSAFAGYLISSRLTKRISPVLGALIVGIGAAGLLGGFSPAVVEVKWIAPRVFMPEFSFSAVLAISLPLAILVVGAENAQAIGVLMSQGYKPPVNAMTVISGLGGIATSFLGGHNANIAGPMTAICCSEEAGETKSGRYAATVLNGVLFMVFALSIGVAVPFIKALPKELVSLLAGLAMIGVLTSALEMAFSEKRFRVGSFFALVIAMSGIVLFKISAPLWALLGGVVISHIVEPQDFSSKLTASQKVVAEAGE